MFSSSLGSPTQQGGDLIQQIKNWWEPCPLFTRFLLFVGSAFCLLGLFSKFPEYFVNNVKTFGSFQITRLVFSPLVCKTIAELIFSFIAFLPTCSDQERRHGTLKTTVDFFLKNIEINIVFLVLVYVLSLFADFFLRCEAYALWGIYMFKIAEQFIENPEGTVSFFGTSLQIPTKFTPIALFLLFSVISNSIRLDIIAGFVTGFIHIKYLDSFYQEIVNDRKVTNWENTAAVGYIRTLPNYISLGNMPPGTLVSSYDGGIVKEAGSPGDFNDQEGYNGVEAIDLYGEGKKYQPAHNDVEDLSNDIEKQ